MGPQLSLSLMLNVLHFFILCSIFLTIFAIFFLNFSHTHKSDLFSLYVTEKKKIKKNTKQIQHQLMSTSTQMK